MVDALRENTSWKTGPTLGLELDERQFQHISSLLYSACGIDLHPRKRLLVQARLAKHLLQLGMDDISLYLDFLEGNDEEFANLVNCLTTNFTSFFREPDHFQFLGEEIVSRLVDEGQERVRLWSAGCSSGEEAYSLAIVLREKLADVDKRDVTILATDISTRMLSKAMRGTYSRKNLEGCDPKVIARYFVRDGSGDDASYKVIPELRSMVRFNHLNLIDRWPVGPSFDVVFFRNVMIYMDKPTQKELCRRFFWALKPGGYFFVGHAESLIGLGVELEKVRPSIYRKAPQRSL